MSSGHKHGDEPAPVTAVVRMLQGNAGLRAHVARYPIINRQFRVPYLAGSSTDGHVTYIDSQVPPRLEKSGVEPDYYYCDHEGFEWYCMTRLGFDYSRAHRLAHGFERMKMKMSGISDEQIEQYEDESEAMVIVDEHLKLGPEAFPPDLYLGPYQEDEDGLDKRLLPMLRAAQVLNVPSYG